MLFLMENFPMQQRGVFRRLWWAQYGAPAHRLVAVRNRLAEVFGHRVIALYHDVEWPPRSPDLTCDFFLWGYLKSKVFITPPPDIATLRQRIIDEFDALRHQAPMNRRAVREMEKRANLGGVERDGGHVEGHGM